MLLENEHGRLMSPNHRTTTMSSIILNNFIQHVQPLLLYIHICVYSYIIYIYISYQTPQIPGATSLEPLSTPAECRSLLCSLQGQLPDTSPSQALNPVVQYWAIGVHKGIAYPKIGDQNCCPLFRIDNPNMIWSELPIWINIWYDTSIIPIRINRDV